MNSIQGTSAMSAYFYHTTLSHNLTRQKVCTIAHFCVFLRKILASSNKSKADGKRSQQPSGKANDISL